MRKSTLLILSAMACGLFLTALDSAYAKDQEIALIYTAQTHAMLYPCLCPVEPDGGVARRATLIKQLKKQYPDSLVLDSGNFFGGGLLDEYTQNTPLDTQRSAVSLASMQLMRYDALAISDDEFNFGKDFLEQNIGKVKLNFLSSNLRPKKVAPYIIKEVAGVKVGIIGLTSPRAKPKAGNLKFLEPEAALADSVRELKKKGAGLIILLSNLGEDEDLKLIGSVPGISVVIDGYNRRDKESFIKAGETLILRPARQGRRLGVAVLSLKDSKVIKSAVEEKRVSDGINDDPEILAILPRCFADSDCKKEGLTGTCQAAGTSSANCLFTKPAKVHLTVIKPKECPVCDTESIINLLKKEFPGLDVSYIDYPDKNAIKFIEDLKTSIPGLPVYLLGKEAAGEKNFDKLKAGLAEIKNYYMVKPEASGVSYFLNRNKVKGQLDLFISLFEKDSNKVLGVIKEFNPAVHFLTIMNNGKFEAARGEAEVEEDLRAVCVQKYYPKRFWDYITCRAGNINSSWWDDCAVKMDSNKIKGCARSDEGKALLKENSRLPQELKVMLGPAYLLDNQSIFSSRGAPSKEELEKIIKR